MDNIDVAALRTLVHAAVDEAITQWAAGAAPEGPVGPPADTPNTEVLDETPVRTLPEGKRVVRTKSSGDRVYLLTENGMTRQWLTNPEVLKDQGFEQTDVVEIEEEEMQKYSMGPAIHKVNGQA